MRGLVPVHRFFCMLVAGFGLPPALLVVSEGEMIRPAGGAHALAQHRQSAAAGNAQLEYLARFVASEIRDLGGVDQGERL